MNFVEVTRRRHRRRAPGSSGRPTGRSRSRRATARRRSRRGRQDARRRLPARAPRHRRGRRRASASFRARADVVEYLGNEELLHVNAADQDIVAIVDSEHRVRAGRHRQPRPAARQAPPVRRRDRALTLAPDAGRGRRLTAADRRTTHGIGPGGSLRGRSRRARRRVAGHPSRALPDVPGRHDRAGRRLARDARHRRSSRCGRDPRDRRRGPRAARPPVPARRPARRCSRSRPATLDVADDGDDRGPGPRRAARARGGDRDARRDVAHARRASTRRPGSPTELMHLYLATDLRPADGDRLGPDEDERLLARADAVARRGGGRGAWRDPRREVDRRAALAGAAPRRPRRPRGVTGLLARGPASRAGR